MVELKIDGHIYKVSDISWEYFCFFFFRRWRNGLPGSGSPKSLKIHFKSLFYFTPAPLSKRKCDKIWGECRKSKPQNDIKNIDISKTVYIGTQKFKLREDDQRRAFIEYFNTLNSLDNL